MATPPQHVFRLGAFTPHASNVNIEEAEGYINHLVRTSIEDFPTINHFIDFLKNTPTHEGGTFFLQMNNNSYIFILRYMRSPYAVNEELQFFQTFFEQDGYFKLINSKTLRNEKIYFWFKLTYKGMWYVRSLDSLK